MVKLVLSLYGIPLPIPGFPEAVTPEVSSMMCDKLITAIHGDGDGSSSASSARPIDDFSSVDLSSEVTRAALQAIQGLLREVGDPSFSQGGMKFVTHPTTGKTAWVKNCDAVLESFEQFGGDRRPASAGPLMLSPPSAAAAAATIAAAGAGTSAGGNAKGKKSGKKFSIFGSSGKK
jgi:hypothetical protein